MIGREEHSMPDGRPDPKVVEIRIEKRNPADETKNPGSAIPGNLRAKKGDEIIWFVSQRTSPLFSVPPKEERFSVAAKRLRNVTLILTFKEGRNPFGEKDAPFVSAKDGQIAEKVKIGPPDGQDEQIHHYGVEVKENGKTILKDVHCPEIIIQR